MRYHRSERAWLEPDLAEDPGPVVGGHQQRRGSARALVAESLHLGHVDRELLAHRRLHRLASRPGEVEVRGVAAPRVRHRERFVRREPGEDQFDDHCPEDRAVEQRTRIRGREQDAGGRDERQQDDHRRARANAVASGHHRVQDREHRDRQPHDRRAWEVVGELAVHHRSLDHRDRWRELVRREQLRMDGEEEEVGGRPCEERDDQVPEPLVQREDDHREPAHQEQCARRRERVEDLRDVDEGHRAQALSPPQDADVDTERVAVGLSVHHPTEEQPDHADHHRDDDEHVPV